MSRRVVQCDTLENIQVRIMEGLPIQLIQRHIVRQIDAQVGLGSNSPASMLELFFVDVNGNVSSDKVLKAASVVEMQMTEEYSLDVLDIVTGGLNGGRELVFFVVDGAREDVVQRRTPILLKLAMVELASGVGSMRT